jgi:hypothetical protein
MRSSGTPCTPVRPPSAPPSPSSPVRAFSLISSQKLSAKSRARNCNSACSEGELQAAGPRRGAAGGRRGAVPEEEGPAGVPPRGSGEDGRCGAVPEGRVPGRRHRRGLLRAAEGRLPDVHGSVGIIKEAKLKNRCSMPMTIARIERAS